MIDELEKWLDVHSPAPAVVVHAGINDFLRADKSSRTTSPGNAHLDVVARIKRVIGLCKNRGIKIAAVCAIPPLPGVLQPVSEANRAIQQVIVDRRNYDGASFIDSTLVAEFLDRYAVRFDSTGSAIVTKPVNNFLRGHVQFRSFSNSPSAPHRERMNPSRYQPRSRSEPLATRRSRHQFPASSFIHHRHIPGFYNGYPFPPNWPPWHPHFSSFQHEPPRNHHHRPPRKSPSRGGPRPTTTQLADSVGKGNGSP